MARADYDGWMAAAYDAGRGLSPASLDAWRAAVAPLLAGVGPGPVVDLGGGTGRFSGPLARWSGAPVVTVEPAAAMAARARSKAMPGVMVAIGTAEAIPLRDGAASAVWMSQVMHHIGDLDAAAAELRRVLRPGGRLLVRGEFGPDAVAEPPRAHYSVYRYFPAAGQVARTFPSRRRVVAALGAAGFVDEVDARVDQVTAADLREFHAKVATRADSTLAALDDDTFAAGLAVLAREAARETTPTPVVDHVAFSVFRLPG